MPRSDPYETRLMVECQRGLDKHNGFWTGSVCRRRDLCREEGRCYFVATVERHFEAQVRDELYGVGPRWASAAQPSTRGWRPTTTGRTGSVPSARTGSQPSWSSASSAVA